MNRLFVRTVIFLNKTPRWSDFYNNFVFNTKIIHDLSFTSININIAEVEGEI